MINAFVGGIILFKMNFTLEAFVLYGIMGITIIWYGRNCSKD